MGWPEVHKGSLKHLRALTPAAGSVSACQRWVLEGKSEGSDEGGGCEAGCGLRGGSRLASRCPAGLRALDELVCYPRPRLYTDMTSAYPYGRCMAGFLATSRGAHFQSYFRVYGPQKSTGSRHKKSQKLRRRCFRHHAPDWHGADGALHPAQRGRARCSTPWCSARAPTRADARAGWAEEGHEDLGLFWASRRAGVDQASHMQPHDRGRPTPQ